MPDRTLVVEGVQVDRDRLAAYQRFTGYDVDDTLPQPYPWVLAFPVQTALMVRRDFPVPLPGLVHLANRVTTIRRLDAADPLTLSVTAGALRPHRRGRTLDVRSEARVPTRELVWGCDSVYLSRGAGTEGAPHRDAPPALPVGTAVARWGLPEDLGRSYAGVSGTSTRSTCTPSAPRRWASRAHRARNVDLRPRPRSPGPHVARTLQQQRLVHHAGVPAEYRGGVVERDAADGDRRAEGSQGRPTRGTSSAPRGPRPAAYRTIVRRNRPIGPWRAIADRHYVATLRATGSGVVLR